MKIGDKVKVKVGGIITQVLEDTFLIQLELGKSLQTGYPSPSIIVSKKSIKGG